MTDISKLGVKEHSKKVVAPVHIDTKGDGTKIMEIRQTVKKEKLAQPVLTAAEAKKIGRQKWHPFRQTEMMTCVVEGRRFMVDMDVYNRIEHD